ncbi:hypothetical protein [Rhodoferax sp. GW822-FHT02A01]|uniref:hypothetical protein n=1 Tax=Rhodoferax sp. GW822-FHT02A01 TaxID=3141537 RepID=UPI00315D853F
MSATTIPETWVEIIGRAEALAGAGHVDAAIDAYRSWLALNDAPEAYAAYFNLAVLYFKKLQTGLAQAALRACLRCNPGFEMARKLCVEPTMDQRRPMAARVSYGHDALRIVWIGHARSFAASHVQNLLAGLREGREMHFMLAWGQDIPVDAQDVGSLSDEAVACEIRKREADVLIDLTGWNPDGRPGIVAYHPAPTVLAWQADPEPSGLVAVDAVVADGQTLPASREKEFRESVLRLERPQVEAGTADAGLTPRVEALLRSVDRQLPAREPVPVPTDSELTYLHAPRQRGRRYVIVAPPYQHASAGIRVLYDLQKWLVLAGYDAVVCTWFAGYPVESFAEDIVVYPEVAPGNVLHAQRVVRFILNTPGKLGHGEKVYGPGELLVAYNNELAPYADGLVLQVPTTEPFFHDAHGVRDKDAVYVGKGRNLGAHPAGCVEITKLYPPTRRQLADLLQTVSTLYTYDDFTMLAHEAKLCGCNVTLIDASGQMRPLQTSYMPTLDEFRAQLHHFIHITQQL